MFQREVAERLAAQPGTRDYGALSVLVQSCCEVWTLFQVAPGSFRPRPKVQSSVVRLLPRGKPLWRTESGGGLDWPRFRAGVHAGFAARRKTIFNSLQVALPAREPAALRTALESAGIEPTLRAEAVPVAGWVRLASAL
jgi:16S rRNA (adenine1518-N6/adenine1519-N6)-dimethyltransferase